MRKMLLTLTTVGVLAVPAGMALAQSDTPEPAGPVPTCVDPVRDRDRDRTADQEFLGGQDQLRTQLRTQLRLDDGTCVADCTGDQARVQEQNRLQDRTRVQDQTGLAAGHGVAAMNRMGEAANG
jgi:hypothetical protein